MRLGCVLLASGFARRFGSNKLLLPLQGGSPAQRALALFSPERFARRAVVSQFPEILELGRAAGWLALDNPEAAEGIASSLRRGLAAMEEMDGVLFAVCDQPWLSKASVDRLIDAFTAQPACITALSWAGERGNPVIFPRDLLRELAALTGDTGGSAVLRAHSGRLLLVEALSARELLDVDTPRDLDS
ncbi:Purine catabolism protein PucB [bioreactor metagenome]|uniref:Purine catabolism protein PucB n=1 Tax=bioreactor metagenome TaxID=1076179 RepID=A0A645CQE3_9ZZZZ